MADNVSRPRHYTTGGIECIDAIRSALGPEGFRAYCIGNVIKYNWRYRHKNGAEDLRKAQVYLGWAIAATPAVAQTDMTKPGPPIDPPETPAAILASRDGHTADGGGVIPESVAKAMMRDLEREDDTGEAYPDPRYAGAACNIGGRCDD